MVEGKLVDSITVVEKIVIEKDAVGEKSEDAASAPEMSETTAASSQLSSTSSDAGDAEDRKQEKVLDQLGIPQQQVLVLSQLARQLEYYFSALNLAGDTYLQTLRILNDGCVPVCILANFAKVKAILAPTEEEDVRVHAILQAAGEYSDLLQVHSIDTATGKIVTDDTPSSANTLLAVGPVSNEPLQLNPETMRRTLSVNSLGSFSSEASSKPSNTVIFRDLAPDVTEEDIKGLFEFEGCPRIKSMSADIGGYW